MPQTPPVVLSIAGFDPSSGAGVTADIKTIAAHGCYGVTCTTAMTVQSTAGVSRVEALSARLVCDTLAELAADIPFAAVRIGMLGTGEVAEAVADFLQSRQPAHVVLDPILKSSSGAQLLDERGVEILRRRLLRLAEVVTPNIEEAAELARVPVTSLEEMRMAAGKLHELGARAVVVTGGHLAEATDLLSRRSQDRNADQTLFPAERIQTSATHGTGCAFATALACNLALGLAFEPAVQNAKDFVAGAIANAYPLGRGVGPVNHLWNLGRKR